jgi:hypothetical protein
MKARARIKLHIAAFTIFLILVPAVGCGKGYKQIVMVRDSNASFVTLLEGGGPPQDQQLWEPGRIVFFRTTCVAMPLLPVDSKNYFGGVAGHIY